MTVELRSAITPADLRGRSLVVLNEADLPAGALGVQLRAQVAAGAMLLVVPGERGAVGLDARVARRAACEVGAAVDRTDGGRWASVDFSNALFEPFRAARADFSSVTVTRYRSLTAGRQRARHRAARRRRAAPVERLSAGGADLMWAGSLDAQLERPAVPPAVGAAGASAGAALDGGTGIARSWFTAPHVLDLAAEERVKRSWSRRRDSACEFGGLGAPDGVELRERGFYEVRAVRDGHWRGTTGRGECRSGRVRSVALRSRGARRVHDVAWAWRLQASSSSAAFAGHDGRTGTPTGHLVVSIVGRHAASGGRDVALESPVQAIDRATKSTGAS